MQCCIVVSESCSESYSIYVSLNWGTEMSMYRMAQLSISVWDVKVGDILTPPHWAEFFALTEKGTEDCACLHLFVPADHIYERRWKTIQYFHSVAICVSYGTDDYHFQLLINNSACAGCVSLFSLSPPLNLFQPHTQYIWIWVEFPSSSNYRSQENCEQCRAKVQWLPVLCWYGFLSLEKPDAYT